jgi:8-oxo-dGTP diphosphatase
MHNYGTKVVNIKNKPILDVVAGILIKDNCYFCAKRAKGHSMAGKWEFPGGKIEVGEGPQQAVVRELKEELSVDAKVLMDLIYLEYEYADFYLKLHVFTCETLDTPLLSEHIEGSYRSLNELQQLAWDDCDIQIIKSLEDYHKSK